MATGLRRRVLSNILHDWNRANCLQLARQSLAVLPPGGHLYLHEVLLEDGKDGPLAATTFSLLMLFAMRGQQFSAEALASLLGEAGFGEITVDPSLWLLFAGMRLQAIAESVKT